MSTHLLGCFLVVVFSGIGSSPHRDEVDEVTSGWMQFRGPAGSGICPSQAPLPDKLDPQSNLRWKIPILPGHSSPIVVHDSIILTGYEPGKLSTICLNRDTGDLRWRRDLEVNEFEKTHQQHGPATPTPASDGHHIYVAFGSFGIISYDLKGNEIWRDEWKMRRNLFGSASSPVIIDGKLVVFAGNEEQSLLQARDPATGAIIWQRRRPGPASSWSTPVAWRSEDQTAVLVYEPFHLRAVSLKDGTPLWEVPGLADEPITLPQIESGLILTTSYNMGTNKEAIGLPKFEKLLDECDTNGDGMLSLEETKTNQSVLSRPDADGQGDHPLRIFFRMLDEDRDGQIQANEWPRLQAWIDTFKHANGFVALRPGASGSVPELAWKFEAGVPECPTPLVWDGRLYAVRNGGVVTCLQARSGELHYRQRLAGGGPYYASPIAGDGKIFLASARGMITIIAATDQPRVINKSRLGEPIWATPALASGQLLIRSQHHLWSFGGGPADAPPDPAESKPQHG